MLISEESHLRRLPRFVHAADQLRMETMIFASDVLSASLTRIVRRAEAFPRGPFQLSLQDKTELFLDAWSMIDQIHVIRQLLTPSALGNLGALAEKWKADSEAASLMRNRMDHLDKQADNLANRKGGVKPLFGGLSILRVFDVAKLGKEPTPYQLVTLSSGYVPNEMNWSTPPFPDRSDECVASVFLDAFDWSLDLAKTARSFGLLAAEISSLVETQITAGAEGLGLSNQQIEDARRSKDLVTGFIVEGTINPA